MKNKTLTLTVMAMMVFIAFTIQIQAQSGDSKKWTTAQAVDFVACSFVDKSIGVGFDCSSKPDWENVASLIGSNRKTKELADEIRSLINTPNIKDKSPEQISKFLSETLFSPSGQIPKVKGFLENRRDRQEEIQELKEAVTRGLTANFTSVATNAPESGEVKKDGPTPTPDGPNGDGGGAPSDEEISWIPSTELLLGLLIGLAFGALGGFGFLTVSRKIGSKGSGIKKSKGMQSVGEVGSSASPKVQSSEFPRPNMPSINEKKLRGEIEDLKKELAEERRLRSESERELQSLKSSIPTPEVSAGYVTPVIDFPQPEPVATSSGSVRSLYFPAPTPDGLFDSRYASSSRIEGESLYVLRLISEVEAEVEFDNSRISVNKARNSPEQILDPVCEGARSPMNQILGIRMTAPGKARLEGDDWRVYEKVKLTYDY